MSHDNQDQWSVKKDDTKPKKKKPKELDEIPWPLGKPTDKEIMDRMNKGDVVFLRQKDKDWAHNQKVMQRMANKEPRKQHVNMPEEDYKYIEPAEGSKLTGGNKGWWAKDKGVSQAGALVRDHMSTKPEDRGLYFDLENAKEKHRQTLANLKAQPKPNLPKEKMVVNKGGQWSLKDEH